jgi:hypothetical protein
VDHDLTGRRHQLDNAPARLRGIWKVKEQHLGDGEVEARPAKVELTEVAAAHFDHLTREWLDPVSLQVNRDNRSAGGDPVRQPASDVTTPGADLEAAPTAGNPGCLEHLDRQRTVIGEQERHPLSLDVVRVAREDVAGH